MDFLCFLNDITEFSGMSEEYFTRLSPYDDFLLNWKSTLIKVNNEVQDLNEVQDFETSEEEKKQKNKYCQYVTQETILLSDR